MEHEPSEALVNELKLQHNYDLPRKTVFNTHIQLDEYFSSILNRLLLFRIEYPDDVELLQYFDRVFWFEHYGNPVANDRFESTFELETNIYGMKDETTGKHVPSFIKKHLCKLSGDPLVHHCVSYFITKKKSEIKHKNF